MGLPDPVRSRAVLIGTRSYGASSALGELPGVTGNVVRLGRLLTTVSGLATDNCRALLDRRDDREVCQVVRQAAREAEDLLLVYFAGHGLLGPDSGELFLALTHSDPDDPLYTAVRFSELREAMATSGARNRVLILDCCFSGRAIVDAMGPDIDTIALAQTHTRGGYTLTATSANLPSIARPGEPCTLFTGALLDLVEQGIDDAGPYLTLDDLFRELDRLLDPKPRQQGSDSVSQLALAPNPRYRRTAGARPPLVPEALPAAPPAIFHRRKLRSWPMRQFVEALVLACAAVGVWAWVELVPHPYFYSQTSSTGSGPGLYWKLCVLSVVAWCSYILGAIILGPALRFPGRYQLQVGPEGLTYRFGSEQGILRWHDVERITTLRSRSDRARPDQVVVWTRQGWVPPRRSRHGPRARRSDGAVLFCNLNWLATEPATVEESIAHYGGALWDGTHGLGTAAAARFPRRRSATLLWIAVTGGAVISSAGVFLLAAHLTTFALLAACLFYIPFILRAAMETLVQELAVDARGILVRSQGSRQTIRWQDITEAAVVDTPPMGRKTSKQYLLLRTPPPTGRQAVPYDTRLKAVRFDPGIYALTPAELDTVMRRWAGERWRGRLDKDSLIEELPALKDEERFTGRPIGPLACSFWIAAFVTMLSLDLELLDAIGHQWATYVVFPLSFVALALLSRIAERLQSRLELHIDAEGLELRGSRRQTRLLWTDISRISVVGIPHGARYTRAVVVWLRNGAVPPRKWRWPSCFTPYSGGLRVVDLDDNGVAAEPSHMARVLAERAGPAWQPDHDA
ncbi:MULTISPECIES: caspase family protein [Streptomyces]|uniref:caspase family protein n=1 Tax=Streptomyces TaxID=1883 RepID=UPI0029310748|nr:caspase family protein [Streptomyces sp. NEAU-HV9]